MIDASAIHAISPWHCIEGIFEFISANALSPFIWKVIFVIMVDVDIEKVSVARVGWVGHSEIVNAVISDCNEFVKCYICIFCMIKLWIPPNRKDVPCYNIQSIR